MTVLLHHDTAQATLSHFTVGSVLAHIRNVRTNDSPYQRMLVNNLNDQNERYWRKSRQIVHERDSSTKKGLLIEEDKLQSYVAPQQVAGPALIIDQAWTISSLH